MFVFSVVGRNLCSNIYSFFPSSKHILREQSKNATVVVYQNMTIVVEFSKFFLGGEKGEMSPEERYQMTAIVKM